MILTAFVISPPTIPRVPSLNAVPVIIWAFIFPPVIVAPPVSEIIPASNVPSVLINPLCASNEATEAVPPERTQV